MYPPALWVEIYNYLVDVMHVKLRVIPKLFTATITSKATAKQLQGVSNLRYTAWHAK